METHEVVSTGYEGVLRALERILDGLGKEDLNWQPNPDCNSIGWLAWHLTRAEDGILSAITGEEQLWITDRWHDKFGRPADARDSGFGHTPDRIPTAFAEVVPWPGHERQHYYPAHRGNAASRRSLRVRVSCKLYIPRKKVASPIRRSGIPCER